MKQQNISKNSSSRHPRELLSGVSLIGYVEKGKALFTTAKQAGDSRQRHSGMTTIFDAHAFTLIELLVVVLIIGILAAIALPQYQKAVKKSQMVEGLVGLKAIVQASDAYYLANGTRPLDFTTLDISFPGATLGTSEGHENSMLTLPNGSKYWLDEDGYIEFWKSGLPKLMYWYKSWEVYSAGFNCRAETNYESGKKMCIALGGTEKGPNGTYTVYALNF